MRETGSSDGAGEAWRARQAETLAWLSGCVIQEVWVQEMALYGDGRPASCFEDPRLPFVQAVLLEFRLADGATIHITNWQDDDGFPLAVDRVGTGKRLLPEADGIFRTRCFSQFPRGVVERFQPIPAPPEPLVMVRMVVGGHQVVLHAGEVEEGWHDTVRVLEIGNGVLVFLDARTHGDMVWGERLAGPFRTND